MSRPTAGCPVCLRVFETRDAMLQHYNDTHRQQAQGTTEVPPSTLDGSVPEYRCGNCRYWGKANNVTSCRKRPGIPAMVQTQMGPTLASLYPPQLEHEWCGDWEACGQIEGKPGRRTTYNPDHPNPAVS